MWDYAGILCNLQSSVGDRGNWDKPLPLFSNLSRPNSSSLNLFFIWCNIFMSGSHHSPIVSIPLFLPSNSSTFHLHTPPPSLLFPMCMRARDNHHDNQHLEIKLRMSKIFFNHTSSHTNNKNLVYFDLRY